MEKQRSIRKAERNERNGFGKQRSIRKAERKERKGLEKCNVV